jgi:signal transduction histidine kinase
MPPLLVVDDDARMRTALTAALEPLGLEVSAVGSGQEALDLLERREFAVVLLDVRMAGMDGYETARRIRASGPGRDTPILFVTAATQDEVDAERGYALGAADYVFSPIRPQILRAKVAVFVRLAQANSEARAANKRRQEFTDMTAHELRAPLGVISGYIALLAEGSLADNGPARQAAMQVVVAKVDEVNRLVDDLLLAAHIEGGELVPKVVPMDLGLEVERAVERAAARARMLQATIGYEPPERSVQALGDVGHVGKILDNLINNALTYADDSPRVQIRVTDASGAEVTVQDCGTAIPDDIREKIFEKLFRASAKPGTGLGLYISRYLAENQGGTLSLEGGQAESGNTFVLRLRSAGR